MTNLDELKREVIDSVTISDLLLASLYGVLKNVQGTCQLVKSNCLIHEIFYALKDNPEFRDDSLLQKLTFDESLSTPYSEEIDTALFRIETAHILETNNPSYQGYSVKEENVKYAKAAFEKLQQSCDINQISNFVKNKIEQYPTC